MKLLWINSVGFDVTNQLLITFFCIRQILEEKMGVQWDGTLAIHKFQVRGNYCTTFSQGSGHP
jgi:hypothetical protein